MRARWGIAVSLAALVGALAATGTAGARGGATGDPATIALYRAAVAATNARPVEVETVANEYWLADASPTGGAASFHLAWGVPRPSAAFVAVTAVGVLRQSRGGPAWEVWTFQRDCPEGHPCASGVTPVEFFVGRHADEWGFRTGRIVACWNRAAGQSAWIRHDWTLAAPWQVVGHFGSAVVHGRRAFVTSTYPLGGGVTAREVDTVDLDDHLFVHADVTDSASSHPPDPAHRYAISVRYPSARPLPPKRRSCPGN